MTDSAGVETVVRDRVLRVTIRRPDKHNALSRPVLAALRSAFESAAGAMEIGCVVLRGAGQRYFAAGGDLRDLATVRSESDTREMATEACATLDAIRECPVPVIALVNGDAIGGGAELAVACDLRVMRAGAHIGYIHGKLALTSAWGGGPDLVSLVGRARALAMTTRCELVPGPKALDWGLADALAPEDPDRPDEALESVLAGFIAPMLRQSPRALRACKDQVRLARRGASWDERRATERENFVATWVHPDHWLAVGRILDPPGR